MYYTRAEPKGSSKGELARFAKYRRTLQTGSDGESDRVGSSGGGGGGGRPVADATRIDAPYGTRFEPVPRVADAHGKPAREVICVTGPSGSGKSHWMKMYAQNYSKLTGNTTYLISSLDTDETLDSTTPPPTRLDIAKLTADTEGLKDIKRWEQSLVLIDDVEGIPKAEEAAVLTIQDVIATKGRHEAVTLVKSSHLSSDYRKTRLLLMEAQGFVVYPQMGGHAGFEYLLTKYGGVDRVAARELLASDSRWLYVHNGQPRFVMSETSVSVM